MWLCYNDAFVSAVQDPADPDRLCVRARNPAHLNKLFPTHPVIETPKAEYACRVFVTKDEFAELVVRKMSEINYLNFRNSVLDDRLHNLYAGFWDHQLIYQLYVNAQRARHFSWEAGDLQDAPPHPT